MRKSIKYFCYVALALYGIIMLYLLYGQRIGLSVPGTYLDRLSENYNLIPFKTVGEYADMMLNSSNPYLRQHAIINLFGNIIIFIPLGFLIPCISLRFRTFAKHLLACIGIILIIEISQLLSLLGSCDIDDLILNLCGTSVGFAVFLLIKHLTKRI